MRLDLLPHEARPLSSGGQASVVDNALLSMMMVNCGEEEGIFRVFYAYGSCHSMFATYKPQDIISLVSPRIGG
jgi:hypothetical protein